MAACLDLAWLWGQDYLADTLLIVNPSPEGEELPDHVDTVAKLHLHSAVLSSASPGHFRQQLKRLREDEVEHASAPAFVPHGQKTYTLTLDPGEPHTVPEAVFKHVYTGRLPDDPEQLIWMIKRADYLDLAATVQACISKLAATNRQHLTLQHAAQLSCVPELQTVSHDTRSALMALVTSILARCLVVASDIIHRPSLLHQFTQLPLPLLLQWAALPSLQYDSGNTLAVLFTAWHDAQPAPPTEEQCQQLSAALPLSTVSICFHLQALPHLKWWRPPQPVPGQPSHLATLHMLATYLPQAPDAQQQWAAVSPSGMCPPAATTPCCRWVLDYQNLHHLWQYRHLPLYPNTCAGFQWSPAVELRPVIARGEATVSSLSIAVVCKVAWAEPLAAHGLDQHVPQPVSGLTVDLSGFLSPVPGHPGFPPQTRPFSWPNATNAVDDWGTGKVLPGYHLRQFQDLAPSTEATMELLFTFKACTPARRDPPALPLGLPPSALQAPLPYPPPALPFSQAPQRPQPALPDWPL